MAWQVIWGCYLSGPLGTGPRHFIRSYQTEGFYYSPSSEWANPPFLNPVIQGLPRAVSLSQKREMSAVRSVVCLSPLRVGRLEPSLYHTTGQGSCVAQTLFQP